MPGRVLLGNILSALRLKSSTKYTSNFIVIARGLKKAILGDFPIAILLRILLKDVQLMTTLMAVST